MRKNVLIGAIALSAVALNVSALEIKVAQPGTFKDLVIDTEGDISTLTISGTMDASDVEYLTGNTGKIAQVQHLIVGDLTLVESEEVPYRSFSIFAEAGGGESAKFYYSKNERFEVSSYTSGLGGIGVVYNYYGTDLAGLLAKTQFPKITLPSGINRVADYFCFNCNDMTEVVIPDNVEEIGEASFKYCTQLETVNCPSKLKVLGKNAFEGTNFSSFSLPQHPVEIKEGAFRSCYNLQTINLENVSSVGASAFIYTRLTNINLSGASEIGEDAFYNCPVKELIVSDKLRVIGAQAFYSPYGGSSDSYMTNLVLYDGLESIGNSAFFATRLSSVNIPSTVTFIGLNAFGETPWDRNLNTAAEDGVVYLGNIAYKSVNRPETVVFKDGTISISANFNMQSVKSLTLPSSVRSIYACNGYCNQLEQLSLNEGLQIIGDNVFHECPNLKELNLPSTLEYIGSGAFYMAGIKSLILPDNLKVIKGDGSTFNVTFGSSHIQSLTLPYGLEELGSNAFSECSSLSTVRLKSRNLRYDGYSQDNWGHNRGSFLVGSGVEKIIIGKDVESIPSGLFGYIDNLARVEFEDSDVPLKIGNFALGAPYDSPAKVTGSIDRVTSIGEWSLENLSFPLGTNLDMPNMKSLGTHAFVCISGVTSMTFNKDMTITQAEVASDLPDLKIVKYDIPNVTIQKEYYSSRANLLSPGLPIDSLIIGPNVEVIGEELFNYFSSRNVIFTPRSQTRSASTLEIGPTAFGYNTVLTMIDFPSELTYLGENALYGMESLNTVYFHGDIPPLVNNNAIPMKATVYVPLESEQSYKTNMPQNNVVPYKLESVIFNKSVLSLLPGDSEYLTARISPAECSEMGLIWSSSDTSVATVNEHGEVVAVNIGKATITATIALDDTFKTECIVNVNDPNSVDAINSEKGSEIKEFFTLDGIKIENPTAAGIYIAKYADGSVSKIMIK